MSNICLFACFCHLGYCLFLKDSWIKTNILWLLRTLLGSENLIWPLRSNLDYKNWPKLAENGQISMQNIAISNICLLSYFYHLCYCLFLYFFDSIRFFWVFRISYDHWGQIFILQVGQKWRNTAKKGIPYWWNKTNTDIFPRHTVMTLPHSFGLWESHMNMKVKFWMYLLAKNGRIWPMMDTRWDRIRQLLLPLYGILLW